MRTHFDAIVVGYGPVGAVAVNMLAQRGWTVAVIDRMPDVYPLPRAIVFDGETTRLFRELGLWEEIEKTSKGGEGAEFLTAEGERIIGFDIPEGTMGAHRAPDICYFRQPVLERILRDNVTGHDAVSEFLEYEAGIPTQTEDGVSIEIESLNTGDRLTLSADWLIAADGASSPIRKALGYQFESLGYDCQWLVVDAKVKDRTTIPVHTQQWCDPERMITLVPGVGELVRWEIRSKPDETREQLLDEEFIWSCLGKWLTRGRDEIERSAVYQFHAATADRWRDRRIFLAGDAVHQTPPFLGQGMVAGIRDIVNLVWKLQMVRDGRAPATLLDTYQLERKPHAHDLVQWAVELGQLMDAIADAHGTGKQPEDLSAAYGGSRGFPRLHSGVLSVQDEIHSDGIVGYPAPTALVADDAEGTVLLDDLIGSNFAILSEQDLSDEMSDTQKDLLARIGAACLVLPAGIRKSPEFDHLLGNNRAVILRPDRYVFGLVNDDNSMTDMLDRLAVHFQ